MWLNGGGMNSIKQKSGLFFICIGVLLLYFTTSANAGRPLILLPGSPPVTPAPNQPTLDFTIDRGCPSMDDYITLNISTARSTGASFASSTRGTDTNIVDVYVALLRPDGHLFGLNSLSEPDVLYPILSSWDVVTADNLTATFPMSQMPINEAGFYDFYIGFFEPQTKSSTGRPVVALLGPPKAVARDTTYVDPNQPKIPPLPDSWNVPAKCECKSGVWEIDYHETTTIDVGVYKLTAVWDGTFVLNAPVDEPRFRPLVPLKTRQVTGGGTLTINEASALPLLGCLGTVNTSAQVTVDGYLYVDKFDLTMKTPSIDTSIAMACTNTTPPGTMVMPFTIPANSTNLRVPAVDGIGVSLARNVPISSAGRPVVPLSSTPGPSTTSTSDLKARCKG